MNFPSLSALRLPKHLSLPLRIALVALGVLILIPLLLPLFVSTKSFKPLLEQQLTSALGRQVSLATSASIHFLAPL